MRTQAACQEARDAVADPRSDALARARVAAHRSRCADCRAYAERIETTADAVRSAAGPGLDDIARARVTARLALAIDELATNNSQRQRSAGGGAWPRVAAAAGLAAVAAAVLIFYGLGHGRKERAPAERADRLAASPPPAVAAASSAPLTKAASRQSRGGSGADADFAPDLVKGRLEVPAGAVVRASVDRYTLLTVIGPAQLVVETVAPQTSLRLESGLLVGEYQHHPGGTLRVHSPGVTTTVVGTVFAVQVVGDGKSRVAVRRGAVLLQGRMETVRLRAGWSWSSGELARPVIPAALDEQFAAHAAARPEPAREPALRGNNPRPAALQPLLAQAIAALPEPAASPPPARPQAAQPGEPGAADKAKDNDKGKDKDKEVAPAGAPRPQSDAAVTADSLYAEAEAAMRASDRAAVRRLLSEVIRRFPKDGLADAALCELARQEQAAGQLAQARTYLDRLLAHGGEKELREPARYLRCRLDLDAHRDTEALACLGAFRRDFPASPHDAEVLALLIGLYQVRDDCQRALPLLDEYTRRYPRGPLDARARWTRCGR